MPKETFFNLDKEKQEGVMRSAIEEFYLMGYEKGNIESIAKKAGVAKGSIYQYFKNKKELFLYCIKWSLEFIMNKYKNHIQITDDVDNIFDYLYQSSKILMVQIQDEREIIIFLQDAFLGKSPDLKDESMEYILKSSDEYIVQLINQGQKRGYIRKDIENHYLKIFIQGVSLTFKEGIMTRARKAGSDIIDEPLENFDKDIKAMIQLLKYGLMGEKNYVLEN